MMSRRVNYDEFGNIADAIEEVLSCYGKACWQDAGDYLIIQDNYGIPEIGVIFITLQLDQNLLEKLQEKLAHFSLDWKIRLTFDDDGHKFKWHGYDQIGISYNKWWGYPSESI